MVAVTEPSAAAPAGGDSFDLDSLGYQQELHRSLGSFASFAAGFSFVSILTTVFQLFAFGFSFGGPAFVWTWPIVFAGQFSVALVFAELSSRYPVSGSIYQWSRRISSEALGWFSGWYMLIGYIVSVSAIAIALQTVLPSIWSGFQLVGGSSALSSKSGATNAIIVGSVVIMISTVIGNIGVGIMSRITRIGVSCELVGVALLIVMFFAHAKRGPGALLHTNGVAGHGSYLWPFLISALMACYVMYGFDSAGSSTWPTSASPSPGWSPASSPGLPSGNGPAAPSSASDDSACRSTSSPSRSGRSSSSTSAGTRASVYGTSVYLQYFAPIFVIACAAVGALSYHQARPRDNKTLEQTLQPQEGSFHR